MPTVYAIDVNVRLIDELTRPLGQMQQSLSQTGEVAETASNKLAGLGSMWGQYFMGREIIRFGEMGVSAFGSIVKEAANLETAIGNVSLATGLAMSQMGPLRSSIIDISQEHAMSPTEAADMVATMARGGIKDPEQLMELLNPKGGGGFADFADIMKVTRGVGFHESAQLGVEFTDLLGAANPKEILKGLEELNKAVAFAPQESPRKLFDTFKNLHGISSKAGVGVEQQIQMSAILNEIGLTGRGGTEVASGLLHLLTSKGSDKFVARSKDGGVDLIQTLEKIQQYEQAHPKTALADEKKAFGAVGLRALGVLSAPEHVAQIEKLVEQWGKMPSIAQEQHAIMEQTNMQLQLMGTNAGGLLASIGTPILKDVLPALTAFANALGATTKFLESHKNIQAGLGSVAESGAGASTAIAGLAVTKMIAPFLAKMVGGETAGVVVAGATSIVGWVVGALGAALVGWGAGQAINHFVVDPLIWQKGRDFTPEELKAQQEAKDKAAKTSGDVHHHHYGNINLPGVHNAREFTKEIARAARVSGTGGGNLSGEFVNPSSSTRSR